MIAASYALELVFVFAALLPGCPTQWCQGALHSGLTRVAGLRGKLLAQQG